MEKCLSHNDRMELMTSKMLSPTNIGALFTLARNPDHHQHNNPAMTTSKMRRREIGAGRKVVKVSEKSSRDRQEIQRGIREPKKEVHLIACLARRKEKHLRR